MTTDKFDRLAHALGARKQKGEKVEVEELLLSVTYFSRIVGADHGALCRFRFFIMSFLHSGIQEMAERSTLEAIMRLVGPAVARSKETSLEAIYYMSTHLRARAAPHLLNDTRNMLVFVRNLRGETHAEDTCREMIDRTTANLETLVGEAANA